MTASSIGGIILSHEITYLLFQRGAFNAQDTIITTSVLEMYMIGLIPFGMQKLFILWLYAKEMQIKAAKIATISLGIYIVLAIIFINILGVSGLALASTIGGFTSLFLTLKVFGFSEFLKFIDFKNIIYLFAGSIALIFLLFSLKEFLIMGL